jgi:2,4-dienoyl-CoA reductase-like NADH-dependent reductase (Old Yellow Enzyme family)
MNAESLFRPFSLKSLTLKNRFVMAPMSRYFATGGIPVADSVAYYANRAKGNVGLILSEGTVIDRIASTNDPDIPHFYGEPALTKWKDVISGVHRAGGKMGPQLWHMGVEQDHPSGWLPASPFEGPSGIDKFGLHRGKAMSESDIADTVTAFGKAAKQAKRLGFDCLELHGAHGYLIDQFFWPVTNKRTDGYNDAKLVGRTRFAAEVIREVRRQVGEDSVIILRISQWKNGDYNYKLANTPAEMEEWLTPLADAGVDIFHCSQRRFWEPEFEQSDLNLAGWAKKLTGKPTITVGSTGLTGEFMAGLNGESSEPRSLDEVIRRFDRGDFDLVAVGRPLIADADWVKKIQNNAMKDLKGFKTSDLEKLI